MLTTTTRAVCRAAFVWSVVGLVFGACGSDTTGPVPAPLDRLLWDVQLSHHAVTLSLVQGYDTLRLTATPRSATGQMLSNEVPVVYRKAVRDVSDTSVTVDTNGLVTAHGPTTGEPVYVVATVTAGGATVRDSTAFVVTPDLPPFPLDTFFAQLETARGDIVPQPVAIDCAAFPNAQFSQFYVRAVARDVRGTIISNSLVAFTSSNPLRVNLSNFSGIGDVPLFLQAGICVDGGIGPVWVRATTTLYGVTKTDSVRVVVTSPLLVQLDVFQRMSGATGTRESYVTPASVTVAAGAYVFWSSERRATTQPFDVVFDDPTAVQVVDTAFFGGYISRDPLDTTIDITPFEPGPDVGAVAWRFRRFPRPGTYHYHSTLYGTTGTIIVVPREP